MWMPRMRSAECGMRNEETPLVWVVLVLALSTGCTQEMANQPRLEPLEASQSGEGVPPRSPVPGTVARGHQWPNEEFSTGRIEGQFATTLPEELSEYFADGKLLPRGRQRYEIYCAHCHGLVGGGVGGDAAMRSLVGMVVLRGFPTPPTYHQERLRSAPVGHIFDVITHGLGRMPAHGYLIPLEDRWAITAYVKALQFSQHAPRDGLSSDDLQSLAAAATPGQGDDRSGTE